MGWLEDGVATVGSGLGFEASARDLGAGAGWEVNPRIALVVGTRGAGAGMGRGLAIIGTGLRNAVALLEGVFGLRRRSRLGDGRRGGERGHGGQRRADQQFGIDHVSLHPWVRGVSDGLAWPV